RATEDLAQVAATQAELDLQRLPGLAAEPHDLHERIGQPANLFVIAPIHSPVTIHHLPSFGVCWMGVCCFWGVEVGVKVGAGNHPAFDAQLHRTWTAVRALARERSVSRAGTSVSRTETSVSWTETWVSRSETWVSRREIGVSRTETWVSRSE